MNVGGRDAEGLEAVMDEHGLTWRSFVDSGPPTRGRIATRWNLVGTPTFYLIDHEGVIRHKWVGSSPAARVLDAALEELIRKAVADER